MDKVCCMGKCRNDVVQKVCEGKSYYYDELLTIRLWMIESCLLFMDIDIWIKQIKDLKL